jgi:L-asparagine oxygenase
MRYHYAEALVGCDHSAQVALDCLAREIRNAMVSVRLAKGTMLAIDNRHMVHARDQIRPQYDGSDRWLQRILLN